jgi:hypothetical protein
VLHTLHEVNIMAIDFTGNSIAIPRANLVLDGSVSGNLVGAFLDGSSTNLYTLASGGNTTHPNNEIPHFWRRTSIANPHNPESFDWSPSSKAYPTPRSSFGSPGDPIKDNQLFAYDPNTHTAYAIAHAPQLTSAGVLPMRIMRVNLATNEVHYSIEKFRNADGIYPYLPINLTVSGGNLYFFSNRNWFSGASYYNVSLFRLCKLPLSSITWQTTFVVDNTASGWFNFNAEVAPLGSLQFAQRPRGIVSTVDGNIVLLYGNSEYTVVEKYDAATLAYIGSTPWVGGNIAAVIQRGGYFWAISDTSSPGSDFVLTQWVDNSTGMLEQSRSRIWSDDRPLYVGEAGYTTIKFQGLDGFGVPVSNLAGQMVRFDVMTNRGIVDADDLALSTTPGNFRDYNGTPLTRSVVAPFDANGIATIYAQSARRSQSAVVTDIVGATYPA